jgi:hypothetical protein
MDYHFDLDTFKNYYSYLLEYICSNKDFLKCSNSVSNIWKTTDQKFLRLVGSFFIKQPDPVKVLLPSSKLYSDIVLFCEKNDDQELLNWVKGFNNHFLSSVAKAMKKNKTQGGSSINIVDDVIEYLRNSNDHLRKLENKNEQLERLVDDLQAELKLTQDKNDRLTSSLENLADEECENFRKRIRTGIFSVSASQSTTV